MKIEVKREIRIGFIIVVAAGIGTTVLNWGAAPSQPPLPDWSKEASGEPQADLAPYGNHPPDAQPSTRFTKAEFEVHVRGMHKSDIRAEFGSPDAVYDSDDSWLYNHPNVYDADAGIDVMARIQFTGLPAPYDTVVSVHFI